MAVEQTRFYAMPIELATGLINSIVDCEKDYNFDDSCRSLALVSSITTLSVSGILYSISSRNAIVVKVFR
jgi:hypothetical protein